MSDAVDELALLVLTDRELPEVLHQITETANRAVPGAESCSITLVRDDDEAFTAAHVGQLALDADEEQYKRTYGPCMDAGRTGLVFHVPDMRLEQRWPDYAAAVVGRGVLSSLSVPLPFQGAVIGALNIYATEPDAFDDQAIALGRQIASYVAVAVSNARAMAGATALAAQMRHAMEARHVIDMAKGILMAQHKCTPDEAFTLLSHASQRTNRKLRDIAAAIVENVAASKTPGTEVTG